jgi:nitronate monooxygenase
MKQTYACDPAASMDDPAHLLLSARTGDGDRTMPLHTRVCDMLGIQTPILLAGMGRASTPELAAAVSNAGGLGVIGAASCGPNQLRAWIGRTRALTDRPFGVDTLLPTSVRRGVAANAGVSPAELLPQHHRFAADFMARENLRALSPESLAEAVGRDPEDRDGPTPLSAEFFAAQMEVVIEQRVPLYAAGLGSPAPWMDRLKANGTIVVAVVGVTRHARQVLETGVDIIVAQGHDGGGHNASVGTMALIPQVVDAVAGRVPVLGAGGIADGRGVAAALMLGAEGAWIGTAFLATHESGLADFQKQALVAGDDQGTVVSRAVTGKPARMVRNRWAAAYAEAGLDPLPMPWQSAVAYKVTAAALAAARADIWPGFAGQGLGMIRAVRPAADVLHDIAASAEQALSAGAAQFCREISC